MLLTTQDQFEDQQITQTLGLVKGSTIRAKHLGSDILSVLRHMVGGELTEYTKMLAESREQAIDRMIAEAESQNADGGVGLSALLPPLLCRAQQNYWSTGQPGACAQNPFRLRKTPGPQVFVFDSSGELLSKTIVQVLYVKY